MTGTN